MELIRKRNKRKATPSNSVEFRREQLGDPERDLSLLEHCATLWENLRPFRERRARAMRFVYGDQWGDTIKVKLNNSAPVVAFFIRMTVKDAEGEIVVPSFWSDNLITLAPGQELTYTCKTPQSESKTLEISGWNIDNQTIEIL